MASKGQFVIQIQIECVHVWEKKLMAFLRNLGMCPLPFASFA